MHEFVLASGSSRRRLLLNKLNLRYSVLVPDVDERIFGNETPERYVSRMARTKAQSTYEKLNNQQVVLAADTIISIHGKIMGKPRDVQDAKRMLLSLSAHEHEVQTAVFLKSKQNEIEKIVKSKVKFRPLSNNEIDRYCSTVEPYDKAGAYAIQGLGASFIEYIDGSYTNVMGLPLLEVSDLLIQAKIYHSDLI